MTKAVGISGSPRRAGNSATLLQAALEGAAAAGAETALVHLNDLTYRGCQACADCGRGGECILQDELTPVLASLREAVVWLLASSIAVLAPLPARSSWLPARAPGIQGMPFVSFFCFGRPQSCPRAASQ